MRVFQWCIFFFLIFIVNGCGLERKIIFLPDKTIHAVPSDERLEAQHRLSYEDVYIRTSDGIVIHGWFVPYETAEVTFLFLHGNGGNISYHLERIYSMHKELKANILIIDYRSYGKSKGIATEEGTYLDAYAAYDYLITRSDVNSEKIVVFGQSLGSAVAVELALHRNVYGIILESPFTSVKDMARKNIILWPISSLLEIQYDSLSKIKMITAPLLVLHGDKDKVVPYAHGKRIFEEARVPKMFYTISGAGHDEDTYQKGGRAYFDAILQFLNELKKASRLTGRF